MTAFRQRMSGHRSKAFGKKRVFGCRALNAAIRKYGWDAFKKEILMKDVPKSLLPEEEKRMISEHGTLAPNGYNLHPGGQTSPMLHPAVRARARERMASEEVVEKRKNVFGSSQFKMRVGKAVKESWDACTNQERTERANRQIQAARIRSEDLRELRFQGMSTKDARKAWKEARGRAMQHARRKAQNKDARDLRDPVADTEKWFGPSFEERHYRGVARTSKSAKAKQTVSGNSSANNSSNSSEMPRPSAACATTNEDRSWMLQFMMVPSSDDED